MSDIYSLENQSYRPFIQAVVKSFYQKALADFLIGYHFWKFEKPEVLAHHLERITGFWEMQLTMNLTVPLDKPFTLMYTHIQLGLKPGELGRWIMLFSDTLNEFEQKPHSLEEKALIDLWRKKLLWFQQKFLSVPGLFQQ